jgi:peptide chain release factor 2
MPSHKEINDLIQKSEKIFQSLSLSDFKNQQNILNKQLETSEIWQDQDRFNKIQRQLRQVNHKIKILESLQRTINDLQVAIDLNFEHQELEVLYKKLETELESNEEELFLNGKFDHKGAILSIHCGAGGVDAQDWSNMLLSMYQAFVKNQNFSSSLVNLSLGEEAGIKSATLDINGFNAYGLLKEEAGVHRLVRISPFNSGKTRETSFALVEVIPAEIENEIKIPIINEKDLKWEYSMSSGKGGQSVNTTYSAVRLVHIPTNIAVSCQNERSQVQNKQTALKYLQNKLAILEAKKEEGLKKELRGEFHSTQWGSQIRSYTLHPYKLIKDHRSGFETNNIEKVLEQGLILDFIWAHKRFVHQSNLT